MFDFAERKRQLEQEAARRMELARAADRARFRHDRGSPVRLALRRAARGLSAEARDVAREWLAAGRPYA